MSWRDSSSSTGGRLLVLCILTISGASLVRAIERDFVDTWNGLSSSCVAEESSNSSVSCHGVRIVRRVVQQLLENSSKEPDIEILDGVSLVEIKDAGSTRRGRFLKGFGGMGPLLQFLEGRELRVRLPKLLPQNLESTFAKSLKAASEATARRRGGGFGGGGGGGGKKGDGGIMIMALMMGKMMAAMGFGALGLLAMKALMVSALALMLSLIVAVKKLTSGGDDHGGHHVVYAQEVGHHHRKKRSEEYEENDFLDLPYRGYASIYGDLKASS